MKNICLFFCLSAPTLLAKTSQEIKDDYEKWAKNQKNKGSPHQKCIAFLEHLMDKAQNNPKKYEMIAKILKGDVWRVTDTKEDLSRFKGLLDQHFHAYSDKYVGCFQKENHERTLEKRRIKQELEKIFEIEQFFPGYLTQKIHDDLTDTMRGPWPYYLGTQASSNTQNANGDYLTRSIFLNPYLMSHEYSRGYQKRSKAFQKQKNMKKGVVDQNFFTEKPEMLSLLQSDQNKNNIIQDNKISNQNIRFDLAITPYQDIRKIFESKKEKEKTKTHLTAYKDRILSQLGLNYLKANQKKHVLIEIMLRNFDGLQNILQEKHAKNTEITKNENKILSWIHKVFDYMWVVLEEYPFDGDDWKIAQANYDKFVCLYDLYHHLVFTLLSYEYDQGNKVYTYENYKNAMKAINNKRLPKEIEQYIQDNIVTKSGMDAIVKSIFALASENPKQILNPAIIEIATHPVNKDDKMYWEINHIVDPKYLHTSVPVIISGVSTGQYSQTNSWNVDLIAREVQTTCNNNNCALILDTTIQLAGDHDPVNQILKNKGILELLSQGKLIIFLAKSFQKYATLGTQKLGAGNITVIGKKESLFVNTGFETLRNKFDDLFKDNKGDLSCDLQWLTHLLTYNGADEMLYFEKVQQNTKKLYEIYMQEAEHNTSTKQSFGMVLLPSVQCEWLQESNAPFALYMDSFGYHFTNATCYVEPFYHRLSVGLEPDTLITKLAKAPLIKVSKMVSQKTEYTQEVRDKLEKKEYFYKHHASYKFDRVFLTHEELEEWFENILQPLLNKKGKEFKEAQDMLLKRLRKMVDADLEIAKIAHMVTQKHANHWDTNRILQQANNKRAKQIIQKFPPKKQDEDEKECDDHVCFVSNGLDANNIDSYCQERKKVYEKFADTIPDTGIKEQINNFINTVTKP